MSIVRRHAETRRNERPDVRMCVPDKLLASQTADIGDRVVLFVDFGPHFKPFKTNGEVQSVPEAAAVAAAADIHYNVAYEDQFMVKFGGLRVPLQVVNPHECRSYKCEMKLIATDDMVAGGPLSCSIPYCDNNGQWLDEVTEENIQEEHRVFYHPLWEDLIDHNRNLGLEIRHRTSSQLGGMYGSVGRSPARHLGASVEETFESVDGKRYEEPDGLRDPLLQPPPERYWPDTWDMKCWRSCCYPCLRPTNCFTRFWATFLVAPLINVTVFSLYYQLYMSELFHSRFWTRLGHYTCMPLIVLTMLTFFAQLRFGGDGCYKTENFELLIMNGSAILALALLLWYTLWGLVQKTPLMGFFMILPLFVLYVLANICFQVAVKNSTQYNCTVCWNHTTHMSGHIQVYNSFGLINWWYSPVLWAFVMSFFQALSHTFEPKLPPRVSMTDHWMSCTDILKSRGFTNLMIILLSQAIFGTVDEFLASARLLPLLNLRVCYSLGYNEKQWKLMKKLVKMSMAYGNPAIDYIGTGGSELPSSPRIKDKYVSDLKRDLHAMDLVLTDAQRAAFSDPNKLHDETDGFVEQYIFLHHFIAKYELQVHAYGPFRTHQDEDMAQRDDERMMREFPDDESFRTFLKQVRFRLWIMEDQLVKRETEKRRCLAQP